MKINLDIANNLKTFRKKAGLSRRALAEKISYSEKSIEKWESGKSVPSISVLCELARILSVTLDMLVYSPISQIEYYLGIDGGGTKTEFVLEDSLGNTVSRCVLSSSNAVDIGLDRCEAVLLEGINTVCGDIDRRKISVFAGLSGGSSGNNQALVHQILSKFGFGKYDNGSDVVNALKLALNGDDGIAVIMGTGVIAYAQINGERKRIGGWGYLLDSAGSGYNIGRDALESAYRYIDGRGEPTIIKNMLEKRLNKELPAVIPEIYGNGKRYIANFTPIVFEAYEKKDKVAKEILEKNMLGIAEIIKTAQRFFNDKNIPIVICGGLSNRADILEKILTSKLSDTANVKFLKEPMVKGAIMCAKEEN
ncbi:MAG: XRE family transcriptional regulator [Clostridia bacterium]|nr:XRE family transcriptional regulator [Clostridia bacterium]